MYPKYLRKWFSVVGLTNGRNRRNHVIRERRGKIDHIGVTATAIAAAVQAP
jgi:hypothetical protein